ncbi:MAG: NmrA/HSCARG family protein [Deltaproteobacteria bacterium]|nr:NmrA/HSCARG family protein [Deltaproteobacteria bacterium]
MAEVKNKKILVTGAIGQLGGAAASALLAYGHHIRVMTSDPEKAIDIKELNVEVFQGDFRDRENMKKALDGLDGAFLMTPSGDGPKAEVTHGKAMIDACKEKDIGHVVYSSVNSANKKTGVPFFDSKYETEEHLRKSGLSYTILRPVWFMENFALPWYRPSIEKGVLSTLLRPDRELQMVSVVDIGRIVAEVLTKPMKFVGREIDIVGDHLTMEKIAEEISRVLSHPVKYDHIPESRVEKAVGPDWAPMFRWLNEHGYDADIYMTHSQFRRFEIPLTSFREYLEDSRLGIRKAA